MNRTLAMPRVAAANPARIDIFLVLQIAGAFAAYFVAGKLGQATTAIRSSNLGPVWPAYGIALAAFLACGVRVWPGIIASAFVVAYSSGVPAVAAAGQAFGATLAALTGSRVLQARFGFDPLLSRLRDSVALITIGAFGSATISASIGIVSLYSSGVQPYSGILPAWLIYWLGDATGVLLVTPLVFTARRLLTSRASVLTSPSSVGATRLAVLLALLIAATCIIFLDFGWMPVRLNMFAFAILPFVIWAAIDFGVAAASLSVLLVATIATVATAFGSGPFAGQSSYINAVLLDILFAVLSVSGLTLASVITEREHAKYEREQLVRVQTAMETQRAEEQERARISRELHDDIGQRLSLLAVALSSSAAGHRDVIRNLQIQAAEIAADIHALSHKLHSSRVELLGMVRAMKKLSEEFARQRQVEVAFSSAGVPQLVPPEIGLCLFRVLQEALQNAVKHSGARRIEVRVSAENGDIHLFVSDAGGGFDIAKTRERRGLGLLSMDERMKMVGGSLTIDSAPGRGTRLEARAPLGTARAQRA
jgi:signal transduction histidine kinase